MVRVAELVDVKSMSSLMTPTSQRTSLGDFGEALRSLETMNQLAQPDNIQNLFVQGELRKWKCKVFQEPFQTPQEFNQSENQSENCGQSRPMFRLDSFWDLKSQWDKIAQSTVYLRPTWKWYSDKVS